MFGLVWLAYNIKAPMALAAGLSDRDLDRALGAWAASRGRVEIGRLTIVSLDGFLALVPTEQSAALTAFAAAVVEDFDGFRSALTEAERTRRQGALTPRQAVLLEQFGYPYVAEEFKFHMTLTDALPEADRDSWHRRLSEAYGAAGPEPLRIDAVSLLIQDGSEPFRLLARLPFGEAHG